MITKNYIKMCEKNEDLQKGHKWKNSDKLAYRRCINVRNCDYEELIKNPEYYEMTYGTRKVYENIDIDKPIYLPEQEHLQEMLGSNWMRVLVFLYDYAFKEAKRLSSMNELWLAFVMKEKFHKIWTGEDWVINE